MEFDFLFYLFIHTFILAMLGGIWDLSSPTRDQICTPALEGQKLNCWVDKEVPWFSILDIILLKKKKKKPDSSPSLSNYHKWNF